MSFSKVTLTSFLSLLPPTTPDNGVVLPDSGRCELAVRQRFVGRSDPGVAALDRESSACLIALVFEAQAAYLRAGDPDPAVAPFDADTDLGSFLSATSTARGTPALDVELR